jgi:hypothetical protein
MPSPAIGQSLQKPTTCGTYPTCHFSTSPQLMDKWLIDTLESLKGRGVIVKPLGRALHARAG